LQDDPGFCFLSSLAFNDDPGRGLFLACRRFIGGGEGFHRYSNSSLFFQIESYVDMRNRLIWFTSTPKIHRNWFIRSIRFADFNR
jgi:hypothetical protein